MAQVENKSASKVVSVHQYLGRIHTLHAESFKGRLRRRKPTIGSWITIGHPAIAEIMSKAGFDWLAVDMEHGTMSFSQAQEIIRVVDLCGVVPLVRVMENNQDLIKRFMDAGAHGVIVPLVNSKKDAEKAVRAVKYPPVGSRGVGLSRAQSYSLDFEAYRKWNQENSVVIVQIEHINAVENLEAIMGTEGVDGFIIGLYDLSGSVGCPGNFEDPRVQEALREIHRKSMENNYLIGQHIVKPDPEEVRNKLEQGVRFLGFGVDFLFLGEYCKNSIKEIREFF